MSVDRSEATPAPRCQCCALWWHSASVPSSEKNDALCKSAGPSRLNIEIEGTGGIAVAKPRNLVGVIFFANTGTPKRGVVLCGRTRGRQISARAHMSSMTWKSSRPCLRTPVHPTRAMSCVKRLMVQRCPRAHERARRPGRHREGFSGGVCGWVVQQQYHVTLNFC